MGIGKAFVKWFFSHLGFEIRRGTNNPPKPQISIEGERSAAEYDRVWAEPGRLDAYLTDKRKELYHEILKLVEKAGFAQNVQTIADIGCGSGYFTRLLAERYQPNRIVGFDFSEEALKLARSVYPAAEFRQHDVYTPINEEFDLLFCTEVLEHLDYPEKALDNLCAAASKIVLTVPNGRIDTFGGHINYWSLPSWNVFLERYQQIVDFQTRLICDDKNIATWMMRKSSSR